MRIQTMSIVCGTTACNAKCPFCISKMTPSSELYPEMINLRNLKIACMLAEKAGATTCLITGKGEPTLYPDLITEYIEAVSNTFPFIELQTNGINLKNIKEETLRRWYKYGLTTVCLSAVDTGDKNKAIYGDNYPDLKDTIKFLTGFGFSTRLSIMMLKGYVDSPDEVDRVVNFCKENKVKQLTMRSIVAPDDTEDESVKEWVLKHKTFSMDIVKEHIKWVATPILELSHGATVYDYKGQNLCLSTCVTTNKDAEDMRQIIFYPDGTISFDWKYKGAVLL